MSPIERALRQAYSDAAQAVTAADSAAEPLALDPSRRPERRRRQRIAKRLLAAAATAVAVAVAVTVPAVLAHNGALGPGARRPGQGPAAPRFFAALPPTGDSVQIRSAVTGRLVAEIPVPARHDFFNGLAATGLDDRTLLVTAERDTGRCASWMYRVQLSATGQPSPLGSAIMSSSRVDLSVVAATPDGSAIALNEICQSQGSLVLDHPGGERASSWVLQSGDQADSVSLSTDGGVLSFSGTEYGGIGPGAKPGTSSLRVRPVAVVLPASPGSRPLDGQGTIVLRKFTVSALSPDGRTLYACAGQGKRDVLDAYDVATRAVRRTLASWAASSGSCSFALDATGTYALMDTGTGYTSTGTGHVSVLDLATGRVTTLPVAGLSASDRVAW